MTSILVVDDEYLIADILAYALEDEGYMVVKASNGQKGLEILDHEQPLLVITDFMMPEMTGSASKLMLQLLSVKSPMLMGGRLVGGPPAHWKVSPAPAEQPSWVWS